MRVDRWAHNVYGVRIYLYIRICVYIRVRNFVSSRPLQYPVFVLSHTYTSTPYHLSTPRRRSSARARERGNSHLRATIKTIDDWRGHLDLKIYLRGSASHTHTYTYTHTGRTLKRDWIIDQLSPSHRVTLQPFPALCRCLARDVYIHDTIDGASNYEISYFISTPVPTRPRTTTVHRRHLRVYALPARPFSFRRIRCRRTSVRPPRSFSKSVKTSPS